MRTNYQNIKFFNKEGYEIPLAKASNIVVKIYSNQVNSERYATIMNGVYMEEVDEEGNYILNNFKILDVGSSFDSENISIDNTIIDLYIDGELLDSSLYSVKDNLLDFVFESFMTIKTTTMGNNDEEYKKYGISGVNNFSLIIKKDDNIDLIFPSYVFTGNIEMETVSTGLHSTESIYFGIVGDNGELLSVEEDNYDILFLTDIKDDDIQFFTFDDVTEEIYKSHSAYVNLSKNENFDITIEEGFNDVINIQKHIATPQYVNFCCVSNEEGVHQQIIYVMLVDRKNKSNQYKIGEFNVIVNFEGEDERFRALFANFGIPDPITYPTLFKSANIKENSIDWTLVNRKSKELFLSYDEIFPYVGTYKALTNAIKFLGYDDVYFREWYKDIKNNLFISKRIDINSTFNDFKLNLTYDDILEDRLSKKKLNKLSLIYMLNKENGEYDESNNPIVINTFDYNVDEIAIKLKSLKEWLEKHILSLNCRIVDITGEGVVYEKIPLKIYGTNMQNFDYEDYLEFTPIVEEENVVLKDGSANINIFIKNNSNSSYLQIEDVPDKIGEFSELATIQYPYINSMYAKAFIECENAKIDSENGYLFVNEGNIYLEKNKDTFIFDKAPIVYLEKGRLKELKYNNDISTYYDWWCKNDYTVSVSDDEDYSYYIKNEQNEEKYNSIDYICFLPIEKEGLEPSLIYTSNVRKKENDKIIYYSILESPVFILKDYTICTYDKDFNFEKIELKGEYIIEILDGKIVINEKENKTSYINISYNEENEERYISVNYQYEGYKEDEEDYINIEVNNIGHYDIVTYAINDSGNIFSKKVDGGCDVLIENKDIKIGTNKEKIENDKDFYIYDSSGDAENIKLNNNNYPSFKPTYMINFLSVDVNPISYKYSNIK